MSHVEIQDTLEFPFVERMTERKKSRWARMWEGFQTFKALQEKHGMLIPACMAADLGGVSRQRVWQLFDEGKLQRVDYGGHVYVSEASFQTWLESERHAGGKPKLDSMNFREAVKYSAKVSFEPLRNRAKNKS